MAVELLPEDQWRSPSKVLPGGKGGGGGGGGEGGDGEESGGGDEGEEADAEAAKDAAGATLFEVRVEIAVFGGRVGCVRGWFCAVCDCAASLRVIIHPETTPTNPLSLRSPPTPPPTTPPPRPPAAPPRASSASSSATGARAATAAASSQRR